ncbi:hypothetical protein FRC08_005196 [Ceratobasidium sp. 394]|nr:hypothetical protein FRC08_005196 [Ceratobasidium sp. 394]
MLIDPVLLQPDISISATGSEHIDAPIPYPAAVLPVENSSTPTRVPIKLPLALKTKPHRSQFISDRQGLPLKQQVAGYKHDLEATWEALCKATDYGQSTFAHLVLLKHQHDVVGVM